jgi:hypothetical protein
VSTLQRNVNVGTRSSITLVMAALLSLSAAIAVARYSSPTRIPERYLDRIRGENPSYVRAINQYQNCTIWNVEVNNEAGYNCVSYTDCIPAGATCIKCALKANYVLNPGPGSLNAWPKPIQAINCNDPGGNQGTCTLVGDELVCNLSAAFEYRQYAQNWSPQ